ncbi:FUSC family protein [Arthrobacter sp. zg-Y809]|uniref:FUSC family protein n=1 Tax=Arthrobacter gengyunqii TaxID=2886940 RepID=A0A9X1LZR5_9MICC|nr:FUSC family protein [Arthrobacter gengyunqii]MCC3268230.1 FUSC family protein [Arthrobacter gengyunqii]
MPQRGRSMERRLWSMCGVIAGMLLGWGAFRMFDGGVPWPLAVLVFAAGTALLVLIIRFRRRWVRKEGRPERIRSPRS